MTRHERAFRAGLAQYREAAIQAYFSVAVDDWLQEGKEEIVRILTFWATRDGGKPQIVIDDETLVELYLGKTDPDVLIGTPDCRWAVYSGPPGTELTNHISRAETKAEAHEQARIASEHWMQKRLRPRPGSRFEPLKIYGQDEIENQGGWQIYDVDDKLVMTFEVIEENLDE